MKWWLFRIGRILVLSYVGVLVVLMFLENSLVYHPAREKDDWQPAPFLPHEFEDVTLTLENGTRIHGWFLPCKGSTDGFLYFHGNAGNLSHRGGSIRKVRDYLQTNVLIIDYPGYGKSEGSPNEASCYQSADAAYDWMVQTKNIAPKNLILYGGSLGGGVAVDLASRKDHRALVLAKTFTSVPDVGARQFPWLPVRWVMRNRFDNAAKIGLCLKPKFISHGDADEVIPFEQGKKLFEIAPEPKEFLLLPRATHNDPLPEEFFKKLKAFLAQHPE